MIELADTSAWSNRTRDPDVQAAFRRSVARGEIATCDMVKLELLVSAHDAAELGAIRDELDELRLCGIGARVWRRAMDVLHALAEHGPLHHRQVGIPDLLIAAAAEDAELSVLHYDRHFELIAEITGQPVRAIAPLGSL
jgi:predicted nucleic acid-binding protein